MTVANDLRGENSPPIRQIQEEYRPRDGENSPRDPSLRRTPEPPAGQFSVILADPPWRYDFAETQSRRIENQYSTMELDAICQLGESMPFADNAVLFMWTIALEPMLAPDTVERMVRLAHMQVRLIEKNRPQGAGGGMFLVARIDQDGMTIKRACGCR